jgi:hypothetical protein
MTTLQQLELAKANKHIKNSHVYVMKMAQCQFRDVKIGEMFYYRDPISYHEWECEKVSDYAGRMDLSGLSITHVFAPECPVEVEVIP